MMRALKNLLGIWSPASLMLFQWAKGDFVGKDQFGNAYYRAAPRKGYKRERRWVNYVGAPEASSVPPEWHGWLHHQTDTVPDAEGLSFRRPWQKPHTPNMTSTPNAYRPEGHILSGGQRAKATGDYEAWTPEQ